MKEHGSSPSGNDSNNTVDFTQWTGVNERVEQPGKDTLWGEDLDQFTQKVGRRLGANTVYSARRRGAALLSAVTLALTATGAVLAANNLRSGDSSAIPTATTGLNPNKYTLTTVPPGGAAELAHQVDPTHPYDLGVQHMAEQLGHSPQPGDSVEVPRKP